MIDEQTTTEEVIYQGNNRMTTILADRAVLLDTITLANGSHRPYSGQMCVMEAAAYITGEPWSDHPQCVSPVIAAFLRSWNDALPDATRTTLLRPLLPLVIGTRTTDADDDTRAWMAVDWLVRVNAPAWFDLTPALAPHASALRSLPPVTGGTASAVRSVALEARTAAWTAARAEARAADAVWAAAWDAAAAAAGVAAWAEARAAIAAWDGDAAGAAVAAGDAAWDAAAAWAAARAAVAAGDAAGVALAPTVAALQASACDLVREMCEVGRVAAVTAITEDA